MSQRDEAKAEVAQLLEYDEQYTHDSDGTKWFDYESGADRIIANFDRLAALLGYSRPRAVETIEELDALPEGSVVRHKHYGVMAKCGEDWHRPGDELGLSSYSLHPDATVLWVPEEAE